MRRSLNSRLSFLALAAATSFAALPAMAQDARQCTRWTTEGTGVMQIRQGNGSVVNMRLADHRNRLTGNAATTVGGAVRWNWWGPSRDFSGTARGKVQGTLFAKDVEFVIDWGDKQGYYSGAIASTGHIYGTSYQIGLAASKTTWTTTTPLRCAISLRLGPPAPVPEPTSDVVPGSTGSNAGRALRHLFGG